MTGVALSRLAQDREGFFLVVEGSQIDWGGHDNDLAYAVSELLAFDDAVRVAQDWIAAHRDRAAETLLIVLSDHETGGLALVGPDERPAGAGPVAVTPHWATTHHTAADAPIWSSGPGSAALGGLIDNTKVYEVVRALKDGIRPSVPTEVFDGDAVGLVNSLEGIERLADGRYFLVQFGEGEGEVTCLRVALNFDRVIQA